jgi:hypothetical protein
MSKVAKPKNKTKTRGEHVAPKTNKTRGDLFGR